jgi:phosphoserine aminotransferase
MISFYPGPSKVYEEIPEYVREAQLSGMLSENHRSKNFMKLYKSTVRLLRKRLEIPDDFTILFTSSATECWEIIAQSLIDKTSFHFFNGSFGEKWYNYTRKLQPLAIGYRFGEDIELKPNNLDLSGTEKGVICITQNETSNGTQVSNEHIARFREKYPKHIIAVDATSSMAGIYLDMTLADVWYASVQKCFGLPAGMAVLIVSPNAMKRAEELGENKHYNSLLFMEENAREYQTHYTPNSLAIYLMNKVLRNGKSIHKIQKRLEKRLVQLTPLIYGHENWDFLSANDKVRSTTVLALEGDARRITALKKKARENGIILGNGYGPYKENTFRIANFPALTRSDWKTLKEFLKENL